MPYMSPSQLDEWSKANGGATARDLGNGTVEYVAGNGSRLVVQRSGDGYGVVDHVLPNGQSGMSAPASNASSGAPAAAPQGASPEQQRLQALLSQFSGGNPTGLSFTQESKQEEIPNPAAYDENGQRNAGVPLTTKGTVWYGTWVRPGTRQRLTVKMTPQGTYETVFQGEDPDIKPDQQQQAKPVRSYTGTDPQTGRPATVTEHSDGSKTYEEIKPGTKHAVRSYTGVDPQTNKPANVTQYDDGSLTYEEVKPGQTARKPIRSYTGVDPQTNKPATVTEYDDGGKTYEEVKPGARQAVREYTGVDPQTNKPAKVTEYSDGSKTYAEVDPRQQNKYVRLEQDKDSGKWFGLTPDGKWEEVPGGPGTTPPSTSRGPSMPQMIVGQSQQALRQYADDLNGQVASGQMTVAERDKRWAEAVQTATFAYNEATLLENARQSDQSAAVSLSNNRLSNSMSGFNTALQVVANLNDKLQPGSNLGGKAFAALLDLQVMQAHRMGAFDAGPTPQMRPSALPGQGGAGASAATAGGAPSSAGAPSTSTSPSPSAQPAAAPAAAASPAASSATPAAAPTVPPGMEPRAAQGARWFNDPKTGEVRWITPDGDIHAVNPDGTTSVIATPANAQENRAIYDAANPPGSPPPSAASTPPAPAAPSPAPAAAPASTPAASTRLPGDRVDDNDTVTIRSDSGATMQVPRAMVGEGPGQYSADPARGGYRVVDDPRAATPPAPAAPAASPLITLPSSPARDDWRTTESGTPAPFNPGTDPSTPMGQAAPDDWAVLAKMRPPAAPTEEAPVSPPPAPPDFAVLKGYEQPAAPAPEAAMQDPTDLPPAALHAIARSLPPWRLTPDMYARMKAAGVPDEMIWSIPNRGGVLA
jgi:hypothetical protein